MKMELLKFEMANIEGEDGSGSRKRGGERSTRRRNNCRFKIDTLMIDTDSLFRSG